MARGRDNQRSKLYAAERVAFEKKDLACDEDRQLSVAECQTIVDKWVNSRWWKGRYGTMYPAVTVKPGKGHRRATASPWTNTLQLPKWARKEWVIAHELAHLAVDKLYGYENELLGNARAWHGREFAKEYIAIVKRFLGKDEAMMLKASFKASKVKHRA